MEDPIIPPTDPDPRMTRRRRLANVFASGWRRFAGTTVGRGMRAVGRFLWRGVEIRVGGILLFLAMLFLFGAWLNNRDKEAFARIAEVRAAEQAEEVYEALVLAWNHDQLVFESCEEGVRDTARSREDLAHLLAEFVDISAITDIPEAEEYRVSRIKLLNEWQATFVVERVLAERCPNPGPEPTPPTTSND